MVGPGTEVDEVVPFMSAVILPTEINNMRGGCGHKRVPCGHHVYRYIYYPSLSATHKSAASDISLEVLETVRKNRHYLSIACFTAKKNVAIEQPLRRPLCAPFIVPAGDGPLQRRSRLMAVPCWCSDSGANYTRPRCRYFLTDT